MHAADQVSLWSEQELIGPPVKCLPGMGTGVEIGINLLVLAQHHQILSLLTLQANLNRAAIRNIIDSTKRAHQYLFPLSQTSFTPKLEAFRGIAMHPRYQEYLVFQGRTMHPVMQVLVGLLTIAVLAGLFFLGLAFFTVFAGVAVVAGLVLWLRLKWLMWRRNREGNVERMAPTEQTGDAIEGDYEIIEHDSEPRI